MAYCLNPNCAHPSNADTNKHCQTCGASLLLRNRYRIIQPLGQGGFGKTFIAQDIDKLNEQCVVKQLSAQLQGTQAKEKSIELFNREAQQLQKLQKNDQIPDLMAYFEENSQLYLVQELINGHTLLQELEQQGRFNELQIRQILWDLLPVLAFVHDQGVIHRDLKPENVLRRQEDQRLILIDFGISKQLSHATSTSASILAGSWGYAAPEQMREGGSVGPASDLYALGAICFHLLTGVNPWSLWQMQGYSWLTAWQTHLQGQLSPDLVHVLNQLLQFEPRQRYNSAHEVLRDLQPAQPYAQPGQPHYSQSPQQPPQPQYSQSPQYPQQPQYQQPSAAAPGPAAYPPSQPQYPQAPQGAPPGYAPPAFASSSYPQGYQPPLPQGHSASPSGPPPTQALYPPGLRPNTLPSSGTRAESGVAKIVGIGVGVFMALALGIGLIYRFAFAPEPEIKGQASVVSPEPGPTSEASPETISPADADRYFDSAYKKYEAGDYEGAIADYNKAIAGDPSNQAAYYNRALAKRRNGDAEGAVLDYDKAIELNPKDAVAFDSRGYAKATLGQYEAAIVDYNKAIELDPSQANPFNNRGNARADLGDHQAAIKDYNEAIRLDSKFAWPYNNRGLSKRQLGDTKGAIPDYDKAIQLDPEFTDAYVNRGVARSILGEHQGALADYNVAIKLNPEDALAHNNRGITKQDLGDLPGSLKDYDRAIALDPSYANAYYNRGDAHEENGSKTLALQDFRKAASLYQQQGRTEDYQDTLERIQDLGG
jgi:serine/threonine protein kinase/tetratricopeptide (TPR) repeat protein